MNADLGTKRELVVAVVSFADKANPSTDVHEFDAVATKTTEYWKAAYPGAISSFEYGGAVTFDAPGACRNWDMNTISDAVLAKFAPAGDIHTHVALVMPDECLDAPGVAHYDAITSTHTTLAVKAKGGKGVQIWAHELGHTLGLGHANSTTCESGCEVKEYDNSWNVMGIAIGGFDEAPALSGTYLRWAGTMQAGDEVVVPNDGQEHAVTISAAGAPGNGPRFVTLVDAKTGATYVVEYRDGGGADTGTAYASWNNPFGVRVLRMETNGESTVLGEKAEIDGKTETVTTRQVGDTFETDSGELSVEVTDIGNGKATVTVRAGEAGAAGDTTSAARPTLVVTPASCGNQVNSAQYTGDRDGVELSIGGITVPATELPEGSFDIGAFLTERAATTVYGEHDVTLTRNGAALGNSAVSVVDPATLSCPEAPGPDTGDHDHGHGDPATPQSDANGTGGAPGVNPTTAAANPTGTSDAGTLAQTGTDATPIALVTVLAAIGAATGAALILRKRTRAHEE